MTRLKNIFAVGALALACSGVAQGAPTFALGGSEIFFNNFENLYRPIASCAGDCLPHDATNDPVGFNRINPLLAGNVHVGDVFAGIINVQNITSSVSGFDTYNSVAGDRFTGYFAQTVTAISNPDALGIPDPTRAHITLGAVAADPFGILAAGEMFRLYSDTPSFSSAGTTVGNIGLATAGTFWASLGLSPPPDTYVYTHTDQNTTIQTSNTEAFLALDIITKGPGYNAGLLQLINDLNEDEVGGITGALVCSGAEIANPGISCTQFVGTSEIEANSNSPIFRPGTTSPWMFASNDPFRISRVPEPGTLALAGIALAGLAFRRRWLS